MKLMLKHRNLLHSRDDFQWLSPARISSVLESGEFVKKKIGSEEEVIYPFLDFHCRVALVSDCDVPLVCKKMYLEDVYSQYMLLHQAMYIQYATKAGCLEQRAEIFKESDKLMDKICAKAYLEAEYLESHDFPTRYIDLFAEQVGFCGLAGYPNFLRADWLREIMSWQSESDSGCFLDHYKNARTTDAVVEIESRGKNGELEEEKCLVHLSSVGLMALAVNLRRIVDTCPHEYFEGFEPRYGQLSNDL